MATRLADGTAAADRLTIDHADRFADAEEVCGVWNRSYVTQDSRRFETYFTGATTEGQILVLRTAAGRAVGAAGLHCRRLQVGQEIQVAGQIGNLGVEREYRSLGPAIQLVKGLLAEQARSDRAILLGATRLATSVLRRAGLRAVGDAERWCKPIRTAAHWGARLRSPGLAKLGAATADRVLEWCSRERFSPVPQGFAVEPFAAFDERFDRLWNRARRQSAIVFQRTQFDLHWRYGVCATEPHAILGLLDRSEELRGYLIYRGHPTRVEVMDVFCDAPEHIDVLVAALLRIVRQQPATVQTVSLECFGAQALRQRLPAFGFFRRPNDCRILMAVYPELDRARTELLSHPANWFLTGGDVDF